MRIEPLRDMVVVTLRPVQGNGSKIQVVTGNKTAIRQADVVAVGPEVRDITVGQGVVVNLLVASQVGESYLVAEPHILGTLP